MIAPSPFAVDFPDMPPIGGIRLAATSTGMKYKNRDDLMMVEFTQGTQVAGVFTKNAMCGIPVDWCRQILPKHKARALVVNAGIANVTTGEAGKTAVKETVMGVSKLLGCEEDEVYVSSTGIIGANINTDLLIKALPALKENLSPNNWERAANAINTTDTFTKGISLKADIFGVEVILNGFIKGSGMIQPNMATMLGYVFTDAKIPASVLQDMLCEETEKSYNAITVDSDTSTSDTVLAFATGEKEHHEILSKDDPVLADFREKFSQINRELAQLVVKDGEGISKFITVNIKGAESDKAARTIALCVANSPLVKCAIAGEDANWGRIAMAIGKSGEKIERDQTSIWIGDSLIAVNGTLNKDYVEEATSVYMKNSYIDISANVGVGAGQATVWTTDLTHKYIDINVDYRS